ncbi:hypothetical protein [uncultured Cohaesibacter sp.]|uniref:hypothetical protein n=1 Tax=uncultured Cohaesibacter sp. TaxID=1002546 RepID=UPI0029C629C7|nr:hypothetical protein [uncultured Cohaesibacter sp.]
MLGLGLLFSSLRGDVVFFICAGLVFLGWLFSKAADARLENSPVAAVRIWQGGVMLPVGLIALTTALATWLGLNLQELIDNLPRWMLSQQEVTDEYETFSKVLTGAINTLIAALWFDNSKNADSVLWPAGQIKPAFERTFRKEVNRLKTENKPFLHLEDAITGNPGEWRFRDAVKRAQVVVNARSSKATAVRG